MKKILFLFVLMFLTACSSTKHFPNAFNTPKYMLVQYDTIVTPNGFINLCQEEGINSNLDKWLKSNYRDFETKQPIIMYLYIAEMDSVESVFTMSKQNTDYNVQKRITTNTK